MSNLVSQSLDGSFRLNTDPKSIFIVILAMFAIYILLKVQISLALSKLVVVLTFGVIVAAYILLNKQLSDKSFSMMNQLERQVKSASMNIPIELSKLMPK